jgi:HSP20 family molecular chaperone IbpA
MYNTFIKTKTIFDELDSFFPTHRSLGAYSLSSNIVAKQEGEQLNVSVLVAGHDPKAVKVDLTESTIHIKTEGKVEGLQSTFATELDETLRLGKEFNGLTAKAKIENGVLNITVDKKEEAKPKKLSITF